ncbi:unnamed protein product [Parnassius apollo]|uniref:(apollo) hypothetical protein n=1 Tax=Parnassius apollo TaxID=110799 RepID=A0A8S3X2P7_PARAO|nr:unnamed protein product [Parnassius apollo]
MGHPTCHFEGHLNSPITDDEVRFILNHDKFFCLRHKRLKDFFNSQFKSLVPYFEYDGCYWSLMEEVISTCKFKVPQEEPDYSLRIIYEASIWNTRIHHESYYGTEMDVSEELDNFGAILQESTVQDLYRVKTRVEHIKSLLTNVEHTLGEFHILSDNLIVEKELTILTKNGKSYLYPTTLLMCVLDNLQTRFYVRLHIAMKEKIENIPGLINHYNKLHKVIIRLRGKYKNSFFEIMKNWDAYCIGVIVADEMEDLGFRNLRDSIEEELLHKFSKYDVREILDLMTCMGVSNQRDTYGPLALYFSNLSKNYGHPVLHPLEGIEKLRSNSKKRD